MENVSEETRRILRETEHVFWSRQSEVTGRMYEILFEKYPQTRDLFEDFKPHQPNVFATALMAHMLSLDDPDTLLSFRVGIARKHVKAGVREEHYPMMADALITAMREMLGEQMDEETIAAWEAWYQFLAGLLIERERDHYQGTRRLFPE